MFDFLHFFHEVILSCVYIFCLHFLILKSVKGVRNYEIILEYYDAENLDYWVCVLEF